MRRFPQTLLTLAFAVFAVGFLVAVLILGSLSDRVGRRPVLIGALIVQLASNVMFLVAPDIGWVIGPRASYRASPPVSAHDGLHGCARRTRATEPKGVAAPAIGGVSLTGGLAAGSFLAGLVVQLTTHANAVVFVVLCVATADDLGDRVVRVHAL